MARYLFQGSYSADGVKGVLKEGGSGRRAAVETAIKSLGGKLEAFYFAFGETDVYVMVDGIDNATAAAFVMGVASTGTLSSVKTTVLLTPEEIDQAAKKTMAFRAAGQCRRPFTLPGRSVAARSAAYSRSGATRASAICRFAT